MAASPEVVGGREEEDTVEREEERVTVMVEGEPSLPAVAQAESKKAAGRFQPWYTICHSFDLVEF
jgi:hypothetical protein